MIARINQLSIKLAAKLPDTFALIEYNLVH